jgi:hypothetical protein
MEKVCKGRGWPDQISKKFQIPLAKTAVAGIKPQIPYWSPPDGSPTQ